MVRISLLGSVEVSEAEPAPERVSSRALALLGYLVSRAGATQPRAHLAGVLWPDSDAAQARTNLRRELHHLRAVLGPGVEVTPGSLRFREQPGCSVDVLTFWHCRDEALAALAAGDAAGLDHHAQAALAAYRGPFMPGCYDDWALEVREDLHRACVDLCDRAVEFLTATGDASAGLAFARHRVRLEPLEEAGHRRLMRLQRARGDRAGAMRTYHHCAALLESELGVTPSTETRAELDAVLADPEPYAPATPARATLAWSSALTLVGRAEERAHLLEQWARARGGYRLVVVTGEPGVGKSRLVADLAGEVRRRDGVVASARCFAATHTIPLAPVAEWLRDPRLRLACGRLDPVWRAEVDRLVPARAVGTDQGAGARAKVDAWQRLRFFEGLARAVVEVDQPLLLVLDDLQWCDKATLSWLSFLASYARSSPVLVAATARANDLDHSDLAAPLETMRAAQQARMLRLGPLSAQHTAQLAAQVRGRPLDPAELTLVTDATAGNPFYLIEALRETRTNPGPLRPADLREVLQSRLAELPGPARQVVGLASAVGRDFSLDLLLEASDLEPDAVVRLVDDLWHRRLFVQRGRGYDFTHDLLRETAYESLTPPQRWLHHRRLAQALEVLYADQPEVVATQLAEQYDRSGQPGRALPFYARAARQATAVFAHAGAVRLWRRCLDLVADLPPSRDRDRRELGILQEMLPPLNAWHGYSSPELEACARRTAELGERLGMVEVRGSAAIALFAGTFVQGRIAESHAWSAQALTLSERCPDLAGQAHLGWAGSALSLGELCRADEHFELACELAGESDSLPIGTRTEVHARCWWAHARWLRGDAAGAAVRSADALELARRIEHPYSLAVALSYGAVTAQMNADAEGLGTILEELSGLCERYGFAYYREWARVLAGWTEGGASGLERARAGIVNLEREGSLSRMPYWLGLVADLHRSRGDHASEVAVLDAGRAYAAAHDDRWWLPEVLRRRAELEPGPAGVRMLERAAGLARTQRSAVLLGRVRADLAGRTSEPEAAARVLPARA